MAVPTLTANSPLAGDIAWTSFNIAYNGQTYAISAGSTSNMYVWWLYNGGAGGPLQTGNTQPTLTADDLLLFINKNGIPVNVQFAQLIDGSLIVDGSILAANIAAGTIEGTNIAAGTIAGNNIAAGTITSGLIAANAIVTGLLAAGAVGAAEIAAGTVVAGIVDSTTITGATIVADGSSGQILVYSGVPAAGNLIASVSGAAGTDAHGNAFSQGVWAYNSNGAKLGMAPTGGQSQLHLTPAGVTKSTEDVLLYSGANNAGLVNESQFLIMTSGKSNGERDAGLVLNSEPADASASENMFFDFGGFVPFQITRSYCALDRTVPIEVFNESWNALALVNSWAASSNGLAHYKLMPDATVWVMAVIVGGSSTTIATLPAGYRPPNRTVYVPCVGTGSLTTGLFAQVTTTGVLSLNTISSVGDVVINFRYPIDGP